jgi:site-specific DNA recombinase
MRLIAYVRVSTEDQQTIENQVEKIRAYCDLHDHELTGVFRDKGASGKNTNRIGLRNAIKALSGVDGIVITKLDRLSRSIRDWCNLMDKFDRKSKTLVSVYDNIDTSTASGKLIANLFASLAQFERETVQERTLAAMSYLRKQGRRLSRFAPYGYMTDPNDDKYLIPCSEEQRLLVKILQLREQGNGYTAIADRMNADGHLNRSGKPFHKSAIWRIVNRETSNE